MRLQTLAITGEGDVHEVLVITKVLEGACDAALVVVPAQAEMLCVHHFDDYGFMCDVIWKVRSVLIFL